MISRRELVTGLLGTGVLASGSSLLAGNARAGKPDVIVIGAGLSGLYAALLLEELGARVQVVEARDRVGGRLHTRFDLPGHPEVGGNTIASGYARVINLAERLGVPLIDYAPRMFSGAQPELVLAGRVIPAAQWPDSRLNSLPSAHKELLPWQILPRRLAGSNPLQASTDWLAAEHASLDHPLYQYLRSTGLSDEEISLGYDINPYFGDSSVAVSALMYLFNDRWIAEQTSVGRAAYAVAGGNEKLPQSMAAALHSEVWLDYEVAAIEQHADGVRVYRRNGDSLDAGQVICSLPASKLRDVRLVPRLQGPQRRLVQGLQYMRNSLVFLVPRKAYWEQDGLSPSMWTDGICGTVSAQRFGADPAEVTGIVVNPRGWTADYLDRLGGEAAGRAVIAEIERLRPAARGALEFGGFHSWWLDPFAAGDWAIYGPGQVHGLLPYITEPHGRIHFCGEHAATTNRGMEGALESAERAVINVSAYL